MGYIFLLLVENTQEELPRMQLLGTFTPVSEVISNGKETTDNITLGERQTEDLKAQCSIHCQSISFAWTSRNRKYIVEIFLTWLPPQYHEFNYPYLISLSDCILKMNKYICVV